MQRREGKGVALRGSQRRGTAPRRRSEPGSTSTPPRARPGSAPSSGSARPGASSRSARGRARSATRGAPRPRRPSSSLARRRAEGPRAQVPLVDPEWAARFVDAVLGNLRCWAYLPHRKTFNYTDFTHAHDDAPPPVDAESPPCAACGVTRKEGGSATLSFVPKLLRCSRCASVVYCSRQCQRNDWPAHKKTCDPAKKAAALAAAKPAAATPAAAKPAGPKLYQCENGCGYHAPWDDVCAHEETCTFGLDVQ